MEEMQDFVNDPILKNLCYCYRSFTENDIKKIAKKEKVNINSPKKYLAAYVKQRVLVCDKGYSYPLYYIPIPNWTLIVKNIEPKMYARLCNEKFYSYYTLEEHKYATFFSTLQACICGEKKEADFSKISMKDFEKIGLSAILKHVFFFTTYKDFIPYTQYMGKDYLDYFARILMNSAKRMLFQVSVDVLNNLFLKNENVSMDIKEELANTCIVYYQFLTDGDPKKYIEKLVFDKTFRPMMNAICLIQEKKYEDAFNLFQSAIKGTGRKIFGDHLVDFYYALSIVNAHTAAANKRIQVLLKSQEMKYPGTYPVIYYLLKHAIGEETFSIDDLLSNTDNKLLKSILITMGNNLNGFKKKDDKTVKSTIEFLEDNQLKWLLMEMSGSEQLLKDESKNLQKEMNAHPSMETEKAVPEWERILNKFLTINQTDSPANGTDTKEEFVTYLVDGITYHVQPKLRKRKKNGDFTVGRNIALKTFIKGLPCMTEQDKRVAALVSTYSYGWYGDVTYELQGEKVIAALVGHPYIFDEITDIPIEITEEKPQVEVKAQADGFKIKTNIDIDRVSNGYYIKSDSQLSLRVYKVAQSLIDQLSLLKQVKTFPQEAQEKLSKALGSVSKNAVVMGALATDSEQGEEKKANSKIVVQLKPDGDSIICSLLAKPFTTHAPYCTPGKGMEYVTTHVGDKLWQTKRNLKKEKDNYQEISDLMVNYDNAFDDNTWVLSAVECLQLLDNLQNHQNAGIIEWPEGEKYKVNHQQVTSSNLKLSVHSAAGWFEIEGELDIDKKVRMKVSELISRLEEAQGGFIQIAGNEYIKLSEQLRKQVAALSKMADVQRGKLKISTFGAPQLDELEKTGVEIDTDEEYRNLIERIAKSENEKYKVPKNINAELRDYQKDGYFWMSRLAGWGAGALLADDMGLGKTLQSITLLLSRAKMGPQLVILPTSLILNWKEEISRFAPMLNVGIMNKVGEDRNKMVCEAKNFDIIICTYGLLITEEKLLTSRKWNTVILDEAHTIKNRDTKMSKAAMKLESDFRLLLTGTPVQNHLSEIWNLMQFANPNLLGSFNHFSERFIMPIERDHDKTQQKILKRIVSPFILRRTKNDVLNELPEKTEITVKVDLSQEEWAYYDTIRQQALDNLESGESNPMQTLTEITRLRQAACNVKLIDKKLNINSSKLEAFLEMVANLKENHHRALVFSQFTSHLALIRKALDKLKIDYLYLDGGTPAKERASLVEQFQQGDMPIFLISLKAGGLGLNLTAADYVIHLDPWWNPAIEEQASDRAYRIGQDKPVTVYRLIAAGTIEEKIIKLHQTKRNLADALLEGGDMSAKLSREEMLALLSER